MKADDIDLSKGQGVFVPDVLPGPKNCIRICATALGNVEIKMFGPDGREMELQDGRYVVNIERGGKAKLDLQPLACVESNHLTEIYIKEVFTEAYRFPATSAKSADMSEDFSFSTVIKPIEPEGN